MARPADRDPRSRPAPRRNLSTCCCSPSSAWESWPELWLSSSSALGCTTSTGAEAFVAGLVGSFVGGLLASLVAGDGLRLRPSGLIGSIVGAIIVTAAHRWYRSRSDTT
jgi:uncharacterized membrane protein YeaQ/YmgE (transglycosylase-associated protein family)